MVRYFIFLRMPHWLFCSASGVFLWAQRRWPVECPLARLLAKEEVASSNLTFLATKARQPDNSPSFEPLLTATGIPPIIPATHSTSPKSAQRESNHRWQIRLM